MSRLFLLAAGSVLSACAPAKLDGPAALPSVAAPATAGGPEMRAPAVAAASATAQTVSIAGCCTFAAPAGATVSTPGGMPMDGFRQYSITSGGETVQVAPLLGAHGWLTAAGGTAIRLDGRMARERPTPGGGMVAVLPLRAQVSGRETLMSLQIRSDCRDATACPLYRAILASMKVEVRWSVQPAA